MVARIRPEGKQEIRVRPASRKNGKNFPHRLTVGSGEFSSSWWARSSKLHVHFFPNWRKMGLHTFYED